MQHEVRQSVKVEIRRQSISGENVICILIGCVSDYVITGRFRLRLLRPGFSYVHAANNNTRAIPFRLPLAANRLPRTTSTGRLAKPECAHRRRREIEFNSFNGRPRSPLPGGEPRQHRAETQHRAVNRRSAARDSNRDSGSYLWGE